MLRDTPSVDIVMAGTFAAWRLGTLQARALPFARELQARGRSCAIVTVPWDMPSEAGVVDTTLGARLCNTSATGVRSFPLAVAQQSRQIAALQPRLLHVFKPKGYGGLAGRLLAHRFPLVIDSDDWEGDGGWNQAGHYSPIQRRLFQWQERTLLRDARAVTAASHLLARRARSLRRRSPDTVEWIPNGLEHDRARQLSCSSDDRPRTLTEGPMVVLYSRFAEFPGDWLTRYLSSLSTRLAVGDNVTVVVVGLADFLPYEFPNLVVNLLGYVSSEVVVETLRNSTIAIYPYADSLISRSKNSVKLLELMAAGCAVIASRIGDVTAVAGSAAMLVDNARPETFAVATIDLLNNPDVTSRLSSTARARAYDHFSIPTIVDRLESFYHRTGVLTQ